MRRSTPVLTAEEYSVRLVTCSDDHRGWSDAETGEVFGLVLPRRGRFRMRGSGSEHTVDVTQGYLQVPDREYRFAHPAGGDECTFVAVGPVLWEEIAGDRPVPAVVPVDGVVELAHRLLLRAAHDGADPAERLVRTVAAAARLAPAAEAPARTARARASRARLASLAREAVLEDVPASRDLVSLARALRVSPSHLSRVFQAETGRSLTRFRNRVRVSRVLARIEAGDTDLAAIAGDLGFADQAHLSRTVRATLGSTPGRVRTAFHERRPASSRRAGREPERP